MRKDNAGRNHILHPAAKSIGVDFKNEGVLKITPAIDE